MDSTASVQHCAGDRPSGQRSVILSRSCERSKRYVFMATVVNESYFIVRGISRAIKMKVSE